MIEFHYNIPERALDSIINSIALHWTPFLSTEEGRTAEGILKNPRENLIDERNSVKFIKMSWKVASSAALGIGAYPCKQLNKEELETITAMRYKPPSEKVNDYCIRIYGWQAAGMGDYPLTIGIRENELRVYEGNSELRAFASMAKKIGFREATEKVYMLQDKGLYNSKFDTPIDEEILKEKISQDKRITYDHQFIGEIQMLRFYWDFFGMAIQMQGYMPEKVEGKNFSFNQPVAEEEIERFARFPTRNAYEIASEMVQEILRETAWPDSAIVQKAIAHQKSIMMK